MQSIISLHFELIQSQPGLCTKPLWMASKQTGHVVIRMLWISEHNLTLTASTESTPLLALNPSLCALVFAQFLSHKIAHYLFNNCLAFLVIGIRGWSVSSSKLISAMVVQIFQDMRPAGRIVAAYGPYDSCGDAICNFHMEH
jgi:hypothetical protein